jgi:shikimate 5-dehydrogenase
MAKRKSKRKHDHEDDEEPHFGVTAIETEDAIGFAITAPHKKSECAAAVEAAEQALRGHETVYEDKARTSVGYSKSYASKYDSVFGKN